MLFRSIGMLLHLQYLSLKSTQINKLPSCIEKLVYLQTLDLRVHSVPVFIPNVLWKLQQLRHLFLPDDFDFDREKETKLRLDGLRYLETLVNFNSDKIDCKDLWELLNLRKLWVEVWTDLEDQRNLLTSIASKDSLLQHSQIKIWRGKFCSEEELVVLRKLICCHHLFGLELWVPISKLPEYNHFSPSLTRLWLVNCELEKHLMPTLEKLPSLTILFIKTNAFMGKEMVCSEIGFPQLTWLTLYHLPNFRELESGGRAILQTLCFRNQSNVRS